MSKIYCINCKYNKKVCGMFTCHTECKSPDNISLDNDHYEPSIHYHISQSSLNRHNDCKLYQRKWWKIWLTELSIGEIIFCIITGLYFGIITTALLFCLYNKNN